MNTETIQIIKSKMEGFLSRKQLKQLEETLLEFSEDNSLNPETSKNPKNLIKQFISAKKIEGCSKRTEDYYFSVLNYFEKTIKCGLCSVDTNTVRDYLINYQKVNNCSNVTLDTIRRILSTFYNWLEEENYIHKNPVKRIHRIKTPLVIKTGFTDEQIEVIRKTASQNKRNLAIVDILLSSGMRVSELVRLNRSSINLNSRTCIVFGKGSKQRETYFDSRTKIELENYLKTRRDKNNALFISSKKGKNGIYTRLSVNTVEKLMRDIGTKTDIENVHPHRFRRTMATRAIDKGMPVEQVQVLLGHSKIDTTLHYANVHQTNVHHSHQKYIC